jgi:hypothetical protein
MKEVIYKRIPTEYLDLPLNREDEAKVAENRRGILLSIGVEVMPHAQTGMMIAQTVAYVVDSEDGKVTRTDPIELMFLVDLN